MVTFKYFSVIFATIVYISVLLGTFGNLLVLLDTFAVAVGLAVALQFIFMSETHQSGRPEKVCSSNKVIIQNISKMSSGEKEKCRYFNTLISASIMKLVREGQTVCTNTLKVYHQSRKGTLPMTF